jgi:O-antigen/teichoic acid export membrane protein
LAILITVLAEIITIFEINPKKEVIAISTKELIKTASPLLFSGLFLYLLNYTNVIVLGIMTNETQVGIYNIAYKTGSIGFLIIVSVSTIITPKMAELYGKGNITELKKLTHNATRLIALLSIPLVLLLLFFSKYILSFWGKDVVDGNVTLIIVAIGVLFSAMAGNVDQILNMTNNQKILRNITIVSFFINLALSIILIPYYIKKKLGFYTLF